MMATHVMQEVGRASSPRATPWRAGHTGRPVPAHRHGQPGSAFLRLGRTTRGSSHEMQPRGVRKEFKESLRDKRSLSLLACSR
ncbi:hypothetical protein [Massilia phosphatilytica]